LASRSPTRNRIASGHAHHPEEITEVVSGRFRSRGGGRRRCIFLFARLPTASYVTARIDRGDTNSTRTTTGDLNAVITVQFGSQVSGNIIALYADFNTTVKKRQLVAEIPCDTWRRNSERWLRRRAERQARA
jgi:hypothetical protein